MANLTLFLTFSAHLLIFLHICIFNFKNRTHKISSSLKPFQSQYIVDEDVMKKWKIFIEPTTKELLGLQDSINKTPQNFHISFTPDYD